VVIEAGSDDARARYTRECFRDYHMIHDPSGRYSCMYRSHHLVGMELGISIAAAVLRKEATGSPHEFRSDVVATAKKALKAGDTLDGEGGYAVYGKIMRAEDSLTRRGLPLGLAHGIKLVRAVAQGASVSWDDVAIEENDVVRLRREMEQAFAPKGARKPAGA
jgi:predicted homoserine dehydrogenase-like protein